MVFTGKITEDVLNTATSARSRTLGPLSPRFDINQVLLDGLKETLPEDAHKIVSGRLFVSLTRVSDRQNIVVSKFTSKDDLIQVKIQLVLHFSVHSLVLNFMIYEESGLI